LFWKKRGCFYFSFHLWLFFTFKHYTSKKAFVIITTPSKPSRRSRFSRHAERKQTAKCTKRKQEGPNTKNEKGSISPRGRTKPTNMYIRAINIFCKQPDLLAMHGFYCYNLYHIL